MKDGPGGGGRAGARGGINGLGVKMTCHIQSLDADGRMQSSGRSLPPSEDRYSHEEEDEEEGEY